MTSLEQSRPIELRQYNERYILKTHFPNSTALIRTQATNICRTLRKNGLSVRSSTCDNNGSVGDYFQCALPESDIDYWIIIVEDENHKKSSEYAAKDFLLKTIINKKQDIRVFSVRDLERVAKIPYEDVDKMFYRHNDNSTIFAAIAAYQQVCGTPLFQADLNDELKLSSSVLLKTMPTLPKLDIRSKNVIRYILRNIFDDLPEIEKHILIRAHQFTTENINFNLAVEGQYSNELAHLTNMGLFEISEHNGPYYRPLWI